MIPPLRVSHSQADRCSPPFFGNAMKRDLYLAGILVVLAGVGIAAIVWLPAWQTEDDAPKTIKPKPEPIVLKKEETKKPVVPVKVAAVKAKKGIPPLEKKIKPEPKSIVKVE